MTKNILNTADVDGDGAQDLITADVDGDGAQDLILVHENGDATVFYGGRIPQDEQIDSIGFIKNYSEHYGEQIPLGDIGE